MRGQHIVLDKELVDSVDLEFVVVRYSSSTRHVCAEYSGTAPYLTRETFFLHPGRVGGNHYIHAERLHTLPIQDLICTSSTRLDTVEMLGAEHAPLPLLNIDKIVFKRLKVAHYNNIYHGKLKRSSRPIYPCTHACTQYGQTRFPLPHADRLDLRQLFKPTENCETQVCVYQG